MREDIEKLLAVFQRLVDAGHWTAQDDSVLARLADCAAPVVLAINKVDALPDSERGAGGFGSTGISTNVSTDAGTAKA